MAKTINLKSFIIQVLRRASYRWPARNEALKKARIERGLYKCAQCGKAFRQKEIQVDHINPVVDLKGFTNWEDYVNRMFCEPSGYQILCKPDHKLKTKMEKLARKALKPKALKSSKVFKKKKVK